MIPFVDAAMWLIVLFQVVQRTSAVSYNLPKLCSNATWKPNATTFANNVTIGSQPMDLFVNTNNTVYTTDTNRDRVLIWFVGSINVSKIVSGGLSKPMSLFVTTDGDLYVDNGLSNGRVDEWAWNATTSTPAMYVNSSCSGLYIDMTINLYCSIETLHLVILKSLKNATNTPVIVAGTGHSGSTSSMLNTPFGIYMNTNGSLYVADTGNNRIQLFLSGQLNGTTVAGNGASGTISLSSPTGISLDADGYLFIADYGSNRIVGSGPGGFRCIAGCSGSSGSTSYQLYYPTSVRFDSYGNLFVADKQNSRIQKFLLAPNSCEETTSTHAQQPTPIGHSIITSTLLTKTNTLAVTSTALQQPTMKSTPGVVFPYANTSVSTLTSSKSANTSMNTSTDQNRPTTTLAAQNHTTTGTPSSIAIRQNTSIITSVSQQQHPVTSTPIIPTTPFMSTTEVISTEKQSTTTVRSMPYSTGQYSKPSTPVTRHNPTSSPSKCSAPTLTLIPQSSSSMYPVQFHRNDDFSIISIIQLSCSSSIAINIKWTINKTLQTTLSELYIPARTLDYGVYEIALTVTMTNSSTLTATMSTFVQILPSGILVNLIQSGASMITNGYDQSLILDPGTYSIDLDGYVFDASKWNFVYYCWIDGVNDSSQTNSSLLIVDVASNGPCLTNQSVWSYNNASKSSLTISAASLSPNRTYQFKVVITNQQNATLQSIGYLGVQVQDRTASSVINIGCVITSICDAPNSQLRFINPTTQLALFSTCLEDCSSLSNVTWKIFQGVINSYSNVVQWNLLSDGNSWLYGVDRENLTATTDLFVNYPLISYWQFEVIYSFASGKASTALNFVINQPPQNGSCSINPLTGTLLTLFTVTCVNWFDDHGIKDYSLDVWTQNPSGAISIAFSSLSTFQVRFPAINPNMSMIHITVLIRDTLDATTAFTMPSISITSGANETEEFIDCLLNSPSTISNNPFVEFLASQNQNTVGQLIISLAQQLNWMSMQNLDAAISNGIPLTTIAVSPLFSPPIASTPASSNELNLTDSIKEMNTYATVREYLMGFITNLPVTTSNSIELQASALTQLTLFNNQLTRTTIMIASDRCSQLASVLLSMTRTIPCEDSQTASTSILQCMASVQTAVYGSLQQRMIVLDSDFNRANTFPADYQTDLDFPWSNPNLFADGNDYSSDTINKNRNMWYQQQLAQRINNQMIATISSLTLTLTIHLNIGQNFSINTPQVFMSLETMMLESLSNRQCGNGLVTFPSLFDSTLNNAEAVSFRLIVQRLALVGNDQPQSNTNLSRSVSVSVLDSNNNEVSIRASVNQSIIVIIPRDPNIIAPSMYLQNVTTLDYRLFNLHYFAIDHSLPISVHFEIRPMNTSQAYLLIYRFDGSPQLNSSMKQLDGWTLLCPGNLSDQNIYTYFIDNQQTSNHQSVVVGIRELNAEEDTESCSNTPINTPPVSDAKSIFTSDYELGSYISGCYYLNANNQWQGDGLTVGPLTNPNQTQCFATQSGTFTSAFRYLPAPINWDYVFANADFDQNRTVYLTVICTMILYLIFIIFARCKDKKDEKKLRVTSLPDNHPSDHYLYQILVSTGHRIDAGTKSKVHFILSGVDGQTTIRTFGDPRRTLFERNGIDSFVMSVPKSLGLLNCIHLWHDNTGEGSSASWFLKYLIIRDLQTMAKYHFIGQQWFAVEKEDGKIERVLRVADASEKESFGYVLSKEAYYRVFDSHLWFSIFTRPPTSRFTRVQRCTCCFVLLFLSMFLNILYYNSSQPLADNTGGILIGPFHVSFEQIAVGIIVEFFTIVPSLLLVHFFRRIRARLQERSIGNVYRKKKKITFPWWCIRIAYGISLFLFLLSSFFIIVRGIEFGDLSTRKWLTSSLIGFFSSLFLIQPIKHIGFMVLLTYVSRKRKIADDDDDDFDKIDFNPNDYRHYSHPSEKYSLFTYRPRVRAIRLNRAEVDCARRKRLKEVHMWLMIREVLVYLCYFALLCLVTYSHRNENAFHQVKHLRKFLLNTRQVTNDYTKISTVEEYWSWLENSFVNNIQAQQWYNGYPPRYLSGFTNDKSSRLIGWIVMRQLRMKTSSCAVRNLRSTCVNDYKQRNEETDSFQPGWISGNTTTMRNTSFNQAFQYQSSEGLDSDVYVGDLGSYHPGGYVYEYRGNLNDIRGNLSSLHQYRWIDNQTRAVIIEMSLYNPNVQLFTSVTLLVEFLSTGGLHPTARFQPFLLTVFQSDFQLIGSFLYMMFVIYFMVNEVAVLLEMKWKYFRQWRSVIQVSVIVCSWTVVGLCIWKEYQIQMIELFLSQTNGYSAVNLHQLSSIDQSLRIFLGFCCFLGTVKCIDLCRYHSRLSLFHQTFEYVIRQLLAFLLMFAVIFISFVCLFYLLFQSTVFACSTVLQTTRMVLKMIVLQYDFSSRVDEIGTFVGPFSVVLLLFAVILVYFSVFVAIINNGFHLVRRNDVGGETIFSFAWQRFRRLIGWKKVDREEEHEARDALMRSEYRERVDLLSERVDQLLDAINRLYLSQRTELMNRRRDIP